jgi:hypothetical protein
MLLFRPRSRRKDVLRQVSNLSLSILQVLVTLLPFVGVGMNIGEWAQNGQTPAQPAGYAFAIWSVIYPLCIAYGTYQAQKKHRTDGLLRSIGFWTACSFALCALWALVAQLWGEELVLFVIIVLLATAATIAMLRANRDRSHLSSTERWLVTLPVSLFAAWVTAASFVSAMSVLKVYGLSNVLLSQVQWSAVTVVAAGGMGSFLLWKSRGNVEYAGVFLWALAGIVVANSGKEASASVVIVSALMMGVLSVVLFASHRAQPKKPRVFARILTLLTRRRS